jgi:dipeptidyl aminopeptidase/acylaminoacyl peptidase
LIKVILEVELNEVMPKGFMAVREGKRNLRWRNDQSATLYWAEALDKGDPANEVEYRDEVFQLAAPFTGEPQSLIKTKMRFSGITWAKENFAIANSYWWNTRMQRVETFNPLNNKELPKLLSERNYQDRYNDPGSFVTHKNQFNRYVLELDGDNAFLEGDGITETGTFPFIDQLNIKTGKKVRLWQAENKTELELISFTLNLKTGVVLTSIESPNRFPNYYLRNIKTKKLPQQITFIENPFKSLDGIYKEVIKYKRKDGLELSATLYLPAGYDKTKKEKLPMLIWAYPQEFKDKSSAGQVTASPLEFTYPYYGSFVFWVTKGYIILDDAAFPIVGEGEIEPNDFFIEQLVSNAQAAIDAVDAMGFVDKNRVAVGGHSYGAFMTANLLTHSNLFAAGIARSGAYNRTLTPFGFQSEERSYWDVPEIYNTMSPFMTADKMKSPLLLIHGQDDNNAGTYTMQSERYFNALKGLGATVRLVLLPKESHGYAAKESILHLLWEQDQWLEKYVKNKKTE